MNENDVSEIFEIYSRLLHPDNNLVIRPESLFRPILNEIIYLISIDGNKIATRESIDSLEKTLQKLWERYPKRVRYYHARNKIASALIAVRSVSWSDNGLGKYAKIGGSK